MRTGDRSTRLPSATKTSGIHSLATKTSGALCATATDENRELVTESLVLNNSNWGFEEGILSATSAKSQTLLMGGHVRGRQGVRAERF